MATCHIECVRQEPGQSSGWVVVPVWQCVRGQGMPRSVCCSKWMVVWTLAAGVHPTWSCFGPLDWQQACQQCCSQLACVTSRIVCQRCKWLTHKVILTYKASSRFIHAHLSAHNPMGQSGREKLARGTSTTADNCHYQRQAGQHKRPTTALPQHAWQMAYSKTVEPPG